MDRIVAEVVRFEDVPANERGSRRVLVRWTDGTVGEGLRWYDDEILVCEGDVIGRSDAQLRALLHRRDREFLERED